MQIAPAIPSCISALAGEQGILMRVIKNPTQPGFNHYLFESVAALVKQGCAKDVAMVTKLEEMLVPPFNYVLSQDVQVYLDAVTTQVHNTTSALLGICSSCLLAVWEGLSQIRLCLLAGVPPLRVPNICSVDRTTSWGAARLLHGFPIPASAGSCVLGESWQCACFDQAHAGMT